MRLLAYRAFGPNASLLDNAIGIVTFGKYSHVELRFPNGECFSISFRDKGARLKRIDINPDHWDSIHLSLDQESIEKLYLICKAKTKENLSYNYLGAFVSGPGLCLWAKGEFCSSIIANSLREIKPYTWVERGCRYSPSRLFRIIRKGKK